MITQRRSSKQCGFAGLKRARALVFIVPALLLLSPALVFTALLVRFGLGTPILFLQKRSGPYGQPFTLLRFCSMTEACDSRENLLPDAQRLARFGQCLRRTSLDELPELFNVVKGDMSLVGPRRQ